MRIVRGKVEDPVKTLIYGPEGIGKSTLASRFPEPVFIDTEGSTKRMDVARLPFPATWSELIDEVRWVAGNPSCCRTLVIDTLDWAEELCLQELLRENGVSSIEDIGYGRGYTRLSEKFRKLFTELDKVLSQGIHIVATAHAKMRKFEQPDEMGTYDRWELKLSKSSLSVPKEWADMVLFCNYKTYVVTTKDNKKKVQGGGRVMYATHHNCWDAKNRFDLPDEMPMEYEAIASVITADIPKPKTPLEELRELMARDGVDEFDIQNIAGTKNWGVTSMTELADYSDELIRFLVKSWGTLKQKISESKKEMPFEVSTEEEDE